MKNFTKELKDILTEEAGAPILSPDEVRSRANTMVILTNQAPKELLAIAGPSRQAILLNYKPLMITFPDQKGVYKVQPDDIVFENHHSGRDVTEAGSQETSYEKFFAAAMKKFGVSSPIELSPDETKKFFNYVDKNWKADEESDGSKTEILPALARGAMAVGNVVGALGDENESGWEDPPRLGGEPSLITPMEGDDVDEASAKSIEKARRKAASGKETGKREKTQAANVKKRVAGSEKTAAEKDRQKLTAQRKRNQKLIAKKTEKEAKRREQEQQSKEREKEQEKRQREREQQQDTRDKIKDYEKDSGDDDKKDKKKNGFFKGLAGAVKQAADKEKSFVGGK